MRTSPLDSFNKHANKSPGPTSFKSNISYSSPKGSPSISQLPNNNQSYNNNTNDNSLNINRKLTYKEDNNYIQHTKSILKQNESRLNSSISMTNILK
jgi:hypothetical protein